MTLSDTIEETERAKYERAWKGGHGREKSHGIALIEARPHLLGQANTILDIGCGHGRLITFLLGRNYQAYGVDIVFFPDPGLENALKDRIFVQPLWRMDIPDLRPFDLGICTDVMEHIPRQLVPASLARIAEHCKRCIFKIANAPSEFEGDTLHMTIEGPEWWQAEMVKVGGSVSTFEPLKRKSNETYCEWTCP